MSISAIRPKDGSVWGLMQAITPYGVLVLFVLIVYGDIYNNGFLYDDNSLIQLNSYLRSWDHIGDILTSSTTSGSHIRGGFYRPLQMLAYLFVFHLGNDGSVFWFHLLNLSLHITNTCLVYRLGIKLKFRPWSVFLAALIWGVHPLQTEAVTYISATADPLFAFFCLWSIIVLLPDYTSRKILKTIPLFILGLLSKETMATFPLLVVTCIFLTNSDRLNFRSYLPTWPLWIIDALYVIWRLHASSFFGPQRDLVLSSLPNHAAIQMYDGHVLYRIYTFLATLPEYLLLIGWPHDLHMNHDFSFYTNVWSKPVLIGFGIMMLAASQVVLSIKKPNYGLERSWAILWFLGAYIPDSGVLIPADSLFFEHWMYLPSVGLFLGFGESLAKLIQKDVRLSYACFVITLVFAAIMSAKTYDQNKIWHDPVIFYNNIILHSKNSAVAHGNLGNYYSLHGQYEEAIQQYKESIEISDSFAQIRFNLAYTYLIAPNSEDHIQDAIISLQRSLELDPTYSRSDKLLSEVYDTLGDKTRADYYHNREKETVLEQK